MIIGYVGGIGTGKTMNAVRDGIETAVRRDAVLVSNIRIRSKKLTRPPVQLTIGHDGIDIEQLQEVIDAANACSACTVLDEHGDVVHGAAGCEQYGVVVVLDEVGILMPARFWQDFPIDLIFHLSQSRKGGADFLYTAQDIEQVDAILRRLTTYIWLVKAFPVSSIERTEKGKRPWFFMLAKWKPKHVDSQIKAPIGRKFRLYRRVWERAYSTFELVRPPQRLRDRGKKKREREAATEWT